MTALAVGTHLSAMCAAHVGGRIDCSTVLEDLKVDMWARGTARTTHECDHVAAPDQVSHVDKILLVMGVAGDQSVSVRDLDHGAVARLMAAPAHHATGNREDVRTLPTGEIDPVVPSACAGDGIDAMTIGR